MADFNPNAFSDLSNAPVTGVNGGLDFRGQVPSHNPNIEQDVSQYQNTNSNIEVLQFPLDRAKFFFVMSFQKYERASLLDVKSTLNTDRQIHLPVPANIADNHAIEYQPTPLNPFVGTAMNAAYKGLKNSQASAASLVDLGVAGAATLLPNIRDPIFGTRIGQTALDAAQVATGLSPNQFFTILLKGPKYKQHSFTWHLVPRNYDESLMIQHIIRYLNNAAAPGLEWGGAVFSFPQVIQCAFWPNWNYLFRFKPAVIQRVSVNYAPGGAPSFYHDGDTDNYRDHPPESVILQIDLIELEYWLRNDFTSIGPDPDTGRSGGPIDVTASADQRSSPDIPTSKELFKKAADAIGQGADALGQSAGKLGETLRDLGLPDGVVNQLFGPSSKLKEPNS